MVGLDNFYKDQNGGVALIFALVLGVIVLVAGLAVDGTRASDARLKVQTAVDSAATAAAKDMQKDELTDDQIKAVAVDLLKANISQQLSDGFALSSVDVTIDRDQYRVGVNAEGSIETTIGKIASINQMSIAAQATAQAPVTADYPDHSDDGFNKAEHLAPMEQIISGELKPCIQNIDEYPLHVYSDLGQYVMQTYPGSIFTVGQQIRFNPGPLPEGFLSDRYVRSAGAGSKTYHDAVLVR